MGLGIDPRRALAALLLAVLAAWALPAGAFTLVDSKGVTHRLADYRGKWVLVNFWATWCPPCLEEMPELSSLHDAHHGRDLVVIGVAVSYQDARAALDFAESMLVSYPIVLGDDARVSAQFGEVRSLPTTFLYDPRGRLATRHVGALTREGVESYIKHPR